MRRFIPSGCVTRQLNRMTIRLPRVLPAGRLDAHKYKLNNGANP